MKDMEKLTAFVLRMTVILYTLYLGLLYANPSPVNYGGDTFIPPVIQSPMTLVDEGESDYVIVRGADYAPAELKAAQELQSYIEQISGCVLPIITDAITVTAHEILVGETDREGGALTVDRAALGGEGFVLKAADGKLLIAGGGERGTLYGVYAFLEDYLGCRWYTPEMTVIPKTETVTVDAALDVTQKPCFEYRDDFWNSCFNAEWKAKQKINSDNGGVMTAELGYGVSYADFCHSMLRLVPESYFETHPEYFSYREDKGARTREQRCLTNPDVLALVIENARAALLAHPEADIMSITQNDNSGYCQCENCKASDEQYGGPSGTNLWFVNEVAKTLKAEFPDVAFDTFAYTYTRHPPVNITAEDNVIVRLCSIECCFCHPLSECGHEKNENIVELTSEKPSSFAEDIKGWSAICERLYIWDYTTDFSDYLMLFPNFHVLSPNMRFFAENNVKGVFEQGNYTGGKSGEFGELRAYLLAKLLWNPDCDVEYYMMDFLKGYYGEEAAPCIKEYIDFITDKYRVTDHLFISDWNDEGVKLTASERARLNTLWDAAEASAGDQEHLDNIRRSRLSFRHYKANLLLDEFSPLNPQRLSENEKLYNDTLSLGITRMRESKTITDSPNFWDMPVSWGVDA